MIKFKHYKKEILADVITPVSMYLKLRDRFPQSILLESSDYHSPENASSFIALEPIANICLKNNLLIESIGADRKETSIKDQPIGFLANQLESFVKQFDLENKDEINKANALFGYTSFDAVPGFESLNFIEKAGEKIPQLSYSLYRFII
jgi:anthranilate synthase component 1